MSEALAPIKYDREGWGPGPWQTEPDRKQWQHAGLACLMVRHRSGHWCGYVGVPREHPDYGKDYEAVSVEVHGGLTYASKCGGHICHVPDPGMPDDVWWLGFDCAHAGDLGPSSMPDYRQGLYPALASWEVYRDADYVTRETEHLARQLRERFVDEAIPSTTRTSSAAADANPEKPQ